MSDTTNNTGAMKGLWKYVIFSAAIIIAAVVLSMAYTQKYKAQPGTITVTGLGEMEFTSDVIAIQGAIRVNNVDAAEGYRELMQQRDMLISYIEQNGVSAKSLSFGMPSTYKQYETIYHDGEYMGQQFSHYSISSSFVIESTDLDKVESVAQQLPALIEKGVNIEVEEPLYYFTKLDNLKHDLIAKAAADAKARAEQIASNSGVKLGELNDSRAGVFQITSVSGNEEFSAGGIYNLTSRDKKARVTVRSVFTIAEK